MAACRCCDWALEAPRRLDEVDPFAGDRETCRLCRALEDFAISARACRRQHRRITFVRVLLRLLERFVQVILDVTDEPAELPE